MRIVQVIIFIIWLSYAIMLCVGCEKQPAQTGTKSTQNARWRAEVTGSHDYKIQIYEVVIDGVPYLVTTGYQCVSMIPKVRQAQLAERVQ